MFTNGPLPLDGPRASLSRVLYPSRLWTPIQGGERMDVPAVSYPTLADWIRWKKPPRSTVSRLQRIFPVKEATLTLENSYFTQSPKHDFYVYDLLTSHSTPRHSIYHLSKTLKSRLHKGCVQLVQDFYFAISSSCFIVRSIPFIADKGYYRAPSLTRGSPNNVTLTFHVSYSLLYVFSVCDQEYRICVL